MELYHKQLNSVAELRREKKRIKLERKIANENAEAVEDAKEADSPWTSYIGIAGDFLSSKGTKNALAGIAMPLLQLALRNTQKGLLKRVAKEVLGGYIKWKAIDFGVTLAMRFIRMQKHKADKQEN
jgi:hypothetical protein